MILSLLTGITILCIVIQKSNISSSINIITKIIKFNREKVIRQINLLEKNELILKISGRRKSNGNISDMFFLG